MRGGVVGDCPSVRRPSEGKVLQWDRGHRRRSLLIGMRLGWASVAVVLAVSFSPQAWGLEPRSDHGSSCRNTVQGQRLMTDDKGYVCNMEAVDFLSGCCVPDKAIGQHMCETCETASKCCDVYEMCVSCCLSPSHDAVRKSAMKEGKGKLTFKDAVNKNDAFEFCRASCRTSSKSTVHGNAYISPKRFCIAPIVSSGAARPDDLEVLAGEQGESCDAACQKKSLKCDTRYLPVINNCEEMMRVFPCTKEQCIENYGHDQPAFVSNPANSEMYGKCLYNGKEQYFSCAGSHQHTKRICPCRPHTSM